MKLRLPFLIALSSLQMALINVNDFGAKGDGSDQTAAIQAAIASAKSGDTVYLPAGTYRIGSVIRASNVQGLRLVGDGEYVTVIIPSDSLAGNSVVQFVDAKDCTVEALSIYGDSNAPPAEAIESLSSSPDEATHLTLRDIEIGSPSGNSLIDGIKFDYGPNADYNNDLGYFDNVTIVNYEHAGYEFIGANSLVHIINGGEVEGGPIGVHSEGGTFRAIGTFFSVSDVVFDFGKVPSQQYPFYEHPILILGIATEGNAGLLRTGSDPISISITGADVKFAAGKVIDFESNNGQLFMSNSFFNFLDPKASLSFTGGPGQVVGLANNFIGLGAVTLNGNLISQANCWTGRPNVKIMGRSHFAQHDNLCAAVALSRTR